MIIKNIILFKNINNFKENPDLKGNFQIFIEKL